MTIELYLGITLVYAYVIMTDLENLRYTPTRTDLKARSKINEKIKELESDLNLSLIWPWLLIKKAKNEYNARKQN